MISQLSLFDIATTKIGSFYKPGDWVKICKVPKIAKHVKCGHLYQIHSVDPTDGRLQFWNPFAAQWDFLFPAEVRLALAPADKVDSVTPVELAVTESTHPPADDSVTPVELAVTESTHPPADDYLPNNAISTYSPRGTARGEIKYYRLSYKCAGKVRHIHIRGGNTDSPAAQAKVAEVRSLLAAGIPPAEVAAMLRNSAGKAATPSCG